ncbi:DUF6086 family protein [Polymorphospora rubra]
MAALFAGKSADPHPDHSHPSGIAPRSQDEYIVDLEQFIAFVAAVTRWFDATCHAGEHALAAGWLSVARAEFLSATLLPGHTGAQVIDHSPIQRSSAPRGIQLSPPLDPVRLVEPVVWVAAGATCPPVIQVPCGGTHEQAACCQR